MTEKNKIGQNGVSVIIPVYNRGKFLAECIRSVLSQKIHFPVEIILADDGSTDNSKEIAMSFDPAGCNGIQILWLDKPAGCKEQGAGPARNRAIAVSQYPYIAFLDSDDMFLPGHLQRLFDSLENHPDIAFVFDEQKMTDMDGLQMWDRIYPDIKSTRINEFFLAVDFFVQTNSIMLRKSILEPCGGAFDADLQMGQDIDLWLRITEKFPYRFVRGFGSVFRIHSEQTMKNRRRCYEYRQKVLDKAVQRGIYSAAVIRKQKAVIAFRLAQCDITERKYFSAFYRLINAALLDPVRTWRTILRQN